ncbi:hypothetical protein [Halalkalibacter krulwichiae]|uniref:Uncharacterized protein n=1 Tax=Halalkalibacter krulwichiae TaxID=199441 RepID=A0A1X9MFV1_9BACI|nr:hypothetical protein [Halalkalibacter krulwichiae]ARK32335.1 hypothetical protein BkAM31D_22125 [Halalkalibacter krulwichiae]
MKTAVKLVSFLVFFSIIVSHHYSPFSTHSFEHQATITPQLAAGEWLDFNGFDYGSSKSFFFTTLLVLTATVLAYACCRSIPPWYYERVTALLNPVFYRSSYLIKPSLTL